MPRCMIVSSWMYRVDYIQSSITLGLGLNDIQNKKSTFGRGAYGVK